MGIFSGVGSGHSAAKGFLDALSGKVPLPNTNLFGKAVNGAGKVVGGAFSGTGKAAGAAVSGAGHAAGFGVGIGTGAAHAVVTTKPFRKAGKYGLIAGLGVVLLAYLGLSRGGKAFDRNEVAPQPLPEVLTPQHLAMQGAGQAMGMESGPMDGMDPYHHQRMVMAQRGQQLAPSQPQPSIISPEGVQQLGGTPQLQGV